MHQKKIPGETGGRLFEHTNNRHRLFYATHKLVCMVEKGGWKFILDQSLSDIEKQLEPGLFYRVNRKYILQLNAIKHIRSYPKRKLLLEVKPAALEENIVSQEKRHGFQSMDGKIKPLPDLLTQITML